MKSKQNKEDFDLKKEQIETLKHLENVGYLDLYFGDESHFGLTPNIPYAWQLRSNPILLPASKGKFLNVIGLMTRNNKFYYEIEETTFNSDKIILFMDKFATQINKKTVVILDNSPIHKSSKFMNKMKEWKEKDLLIYFLPAYSPELNLIEILWKRIKYQWLPYDSYLSFSNLKLNLKKTLDDFGINTTIKFY